MTREEAIKALNEYGTLFPSDKIEAIDIAIEALKQVTGKLNNPDDSLLTADSEACKEQKSKLDLISRAETVKRLLLFKQSRAKSVSRYDMGFVDGLSHAINILDLVPLVYIPSINIIDLAPSADRPSDEEDQLKFYYVESVDDYWIGMRIDNFYYADWHEGLGFVWSRSKHLPRGEHIVDENTLWKEHTYPSEPIEIFFTKWIVGFVKKYFAYRPKGDWINENGTYYANCSKCGYQMDTHQERGYFRYCPNCGSRMK